MFRPARFLLLVALLALYGCASAPLAGNLEVRTTGDAQVYGVYTSRSFGSDRR